MAPTTRSQKKIESPTATLVEPTVETTSKFMVKVSEKTLNPILENFTNFVAKEMNLQLSPDLYKTFIEQYISFPEKKSKTPTDRIKRQFNLKPVGPFSDNDIITMATVLTKSTAKDPAKQLEQSKFHKHPTS